MAHNVSPANVNRTQTERKFTPMENRSRTLRHFAQTGLAWLACGLALLPGWAGDGLVGQTPIATASPIGNDEDAQKMLLRGDSLQLASKWVAALSMYKGAQQRTFDPCLACPAAIGIAEVHLKSENHHEARWATEAASELASQCGQPHDLVLRISDLWLGLNEDGKARDAIAAGLESRPHPALWSEKVMLAHLSGNPHSTIKAHKAWKSNGGEADDPLRVAQVNAALLQAQVMRDTVWLAQEEAAFERALESLSPAEECALREQVYLVLKAEGQTLTALQWAQTIRDRTPASDLAGRTLAELRIAHCAREAHRPLEALIAFHEAERSARATEDNSLLAETLRQVAFFETERGNAPAALTAWAQVDSLNQALLAQITPRARGRQRQFTTFVTPLPDPFEAAAQDYLIQSAPGPRGGLDLRGNPWVWLSALFSIGMMAFAINNRSVRQVLRQERQRLATLRQLVQAHPKALDPDPTGAAGFSLIPQIHGEAVQSIEAVLRDIDAALEEPVTFEVLAARPILVPQSTIDRLKPLVTELLRLQMRKEIFGSTPLSIQVTDQDKAWQIRLNGPRISTSPNLRALFQPLPNLNTEEPSNRLRQTLQDLAAQLTVERGDGQRESWIFTLPMTLG